jgi:hypothetical protein
MHLAPRHQALLGCVAIAVMAICGPVLTTTAAAVTVHNSSPHETAPHEHSPHSATAHEHLPHTSRALADIGAFTTTFDAPPPRPGTTPIPRSDVARVRIANALPPADQLSAPVVVAAAALLVLGFLLHPFRKARRRRAHSSPSSSASETAEVESSTAPETAEAESPETVEAESPETVEAEAVEEISSSDAEDANEPGASEELVSQTERAR